MMYCNKIELEYELIISKGKGKPTDKLLNLFELIAKGIISKHNDSLDMDRFQEAMLKLLSNWKNVDATDPNAFSYLSAIAINASNSTYNKILLGTTKQKMLEQYGKIVKFVSIPKKNWNL